MNCPKCQTPMYKNRHKEITPKILKQPYYFTEWFVCPNCKYVQHFEKNKVKNHDRR